MVKVKEIPQTAAIAWSHTANPLLATGTLAGVMDDTFSSESVLQIHDPFAKESDKKPLAEGSIEGKFHSLSWSKPYDAYSKGLLAGGLENGLIQLWNSDKFLNNGDLKAAHVSDLKKHTSGVLKVAFNPIQHHILASSGHKGEILVWDTKKSTSFTPGQAISPLDKVSSLSWNNSMSHIFASAGNTGYASIWDLKAKREIQIPLQ
ncbi:unnamed protein product [Ambrosiozyma monospora]|uniref:Protein transport protein SEC31 n=1 Tax=Ambrosiozyma monospora TaxID=43982 RepID=A0A9W6Z034_AMBMO|nr:unnamed protein product [Ambrosiozyma monospora]